MAQGKKELQSAFERLEREMPESLARALRWLRRPRSRWVRIPVGVLFIVGGIFSFLPALGIWMLPLGLLLLAYDVPVLRRPIARFTIWSVEKWASFRNWLRRRRAQPHRSSRELNESERASHRRAIP
jgi:hypothetical protein